MQSKDSDAVKYFIEKVENINDYDVFYNTTPLMLAIHLQKAKLAKFLIENGADPLMFVPQKKHSAFTKSVSHSMYELVEHIVENYPEKITDIINDPEQMLSPQFLSYKDARMMNILLKAGADPHFGGKEAPSPVVKAIEKAGIGILPVLAKNKVNLNIPTDGKSLLEWAIIHNRIDWVTGLLAEGANPREENEEGKNALQFAESIEGRSAIVAILKEEME